MCKSPNADQAREIISLRVTSDIKQYLLTQCENAELSFGGMMEQIAFRMQQGEITLWKINLDLNSSNPKQLNDL